MWRENARRTLPALTECTGQLVCGEDLGMVPQCVQPVLEDLGILGLRIQRMPHFPGLDGEFGAPSTYAYDTVCRYVLGLSQIPPPCFDDCPE